MLIRIIVLLGLVLVTSGGPTMYKKNDQNIYEPGQWSLNVNFEIFTLFFSFFIWFWMPNGLHPHSLLIERKTPNMWLKNRTDLVAVSSTVIPEVEIKSEALVDQMDMEYKKAYLKLFGKKKYSERFEKPDTLFTGKIFDNWISRLWMDLCVSYMGFIRI